MKTHNFNQLFDGFNIAAHGIIDLSTGNGYRFRRGSDVSIGKRKINMFETGRSEAARWMSNYILSEADKPKEKRSLPDSPEAIVRSRLHLPLGAVMQANEALLALLRSGDLKIAEVRPKERINMDTAMKKVQTKLDLDRLIVSQRV